MSAELLVSMLPYSVNGQARNVGGTEKVEISTVHNSSGASVVAAPTVILMQTLAIVNTNELRKAINAVLAVG